METGNLKERLAKAFEDVEQVIKDNNTYSISINGKENIIQMYDSHWQKLKEEGHFYKKLRIEGLESDFLILNGILTENDIPNNTTSKKYRFIHILAGVVEYNNKQYNYLSAPILINPDQNLRLTSITPAAIVIMIISDKKDLDFILNLNDLNLNGNT